MGIILSLIIGAVCGWLAGKIMKSEGGLLFNIILGILGGFVGGLLFGLIGISFNGIIGNIICGAAGSCLLIWIVRKIKK